MGGCCCCSSRRSQLNATPVYYYCPRTLEEREPLSSQHDAASALSTGLLVDTNLDLSSPDTYRAPPVPIPYDVELGRPQTPPVTQGSNADKSDNVLQPTDAEAVGETVSASGNEISATCGSMKESDCKIDASPKESEVEPTKELEVEPSKLSEPIAPVVEEDVCPTCFEEYDKENPRIITKCEHHFHLSCILEWMERSDTCPICDQEMIFSQS